MFRVFFCMSDAFGSRSKRRKEWCTGSVPSLSRDRGSLRDTRPQTKMQRLDWSLSRKVTQDIKTQPQINHYHQTPSASPRHDPPCSTCFPTHPPSLGHMTRFTLSHHYAERMRPWRRTVRTRAWAERTPCKRSTLIPWFTSLWSIARSLRSLIMVKRWPPGTDEPSRSHPFPAVSTPVVPHSIPTASKSMMWTGVKWHGTTGERHGRRELGM